MTDLPATDPPAALIHVLQAARILVDKGQVKYICPAIEEVGDLHPDLAEPCAFLIDYIAAQLGGVCATLWAWLPDDLSDEVGSHDFRMHLARLAWIDRMIHELETHHRLP